MAPVAGKQVLDAMLEGDARPPAAIVEANSWSQVRALGNRPIGTSFTSVCCLLPLQITDPAQIRALCDAVLHDPQHADTVAKVRAVSHVDARGVPVMPWCRCNARLAACCVARL